MKNTLATLVISCMLLACKNGHENRAYPLIDKAAMFYGKAILIAKEDKADSALILLEQAFKEGLESPMRVVTESELQVVIDNPGTRSGLRTLLKEYAREYQCDMVSDGEAGK